MRNGPPSRWANPSQLSDRGVYDAQNGILTIRKVTLEDQASYNCRVDFKTNPTLTYTVNLTVIGK